MNLLHRHHWRAVKADQSLVSYTTRLLYHCDGCGKNKTDTIDGHWTLDELNGFKMVWGSEMRP